MATTTNESKTYHSVRIEIVNCTGQVLESKARAASQHAGWNGPNEFREHASTSIAGDTSTEQLAGESSYWIGGASSKDSLEIIFVYSHGAPSVKTTDSSKYKVQAVEIGHSDEGEHAWAVLRKSCFLPWTCRV